MKRRRLAIAAATFAVGAIALLVAVLAVRGLVSVRGTLDVRLERYSSQGTYPFLCLGSAETIEVRRMELPSEVPRGRPKNSISLNEVKPTEGYHAYWIVSRKSAIGSWADRLAKREHWDTVARALDMMVFEHEGATYVGEYERASKVIVHYVAIAEQHKLQQLWQYALSVAVPDGNRWLPRLAKAQKR